MKAFDEREVEAIIDLALDKHMERRRTKALTTEEELIEDVQPQPEIDNVIVYIIHTNLV